MSYLLGIDIGTSGLKTILMREDGRIFAEAHSSYSMKSPKTNYAEQHPETWWKAACETIQDIQSQAPQLFSDISAIGLSGQMHSIVLLDNEGKVIRSSIIWCDRRSKNLIPQVHKLINEKSLGEITLNPLAAGFSLLSLLWIKQNEAHNFDRIHKIIMPKDYIRYRLTGEIATDTTDASGTMLFDTSTIKWSEEITSKTGIDINILPKNALPHEIAGSITKTSARETGLKKGTPVVYGGGDQPMQALGNGIISQGTISSTIGTGGQIFTLVTKPLYDKKLRTHTFCNAVNGTWNIIGGTLSAGMSLRWLNEKIINTEPYDILDQQASKLSPGSGGLIFLPYLIGERTPHMNPEAKGVFFGLTINHEKYHIVRSVMEGVVYSLRDSLEIFKELGLDVKRIIASGGGARSSLWKQIQADVFGKEIYTSSTREQACTGAAIMAGVGTNTYRNVKEACETVISLNRDVTEPKKENAEVYEILFKTYQKLYRNTKELLPEINSIA